MKKISYCRWLYFIFLLAFILLFSIPSLALIPGDFGSAGGGPPDGVVDFEDLMIFALAYGTTPSDTNWNEACDIASPGSLIPDGIIDFEDLMIFAMNYGRRDKITGVVAEAWTYHESESISHSINVFWDAYSGADGYKVYKIVNGTVEEEPIYSGPGETLTDNKILLPGQDTDIVIGSTYSYYIIAYGGFGETTPSNETVNIDTFLPSCSLTDPIDDAEIDDPSFNLIWSPVGPEPYEGSIESGKTELWVYDMTVGEEVWFIQFDDMTSSTITYNQDGQATPLVNGHRYQWNFWCYGYDTYGRQIAISASETWEFTYTGESMGAIRGVVTLVIENPPDESRVFPGAARIGILGTEQFTISSFSDGTYTLINISVGFHTITIFKHGFFSAQLGVFVGDGQVTDVNFNLTSEVRADQLGGIYYLGFNLDIPPFDNLKVRQALNYAIDKQTLVDEINTEFGVSKVVAQGPIPPSMIGYNSSLVGYSYDVAEAQDLLSQAGYPEGFNTDLYYNILDSGFHYFVAQKIQIYLAQVGINAELHGLEWTELLGLVDQGGLPFFRMGWIADTPDPTDLLYSLYHSASSNNYSHYQNSVVDSQIEQAWQIIDDASFIQLVQQIEETIVEKAPAIFLYYY